jgi:hypothetical protein
MTQIVLIGFGAGAAAALLFASVTSGAVFSVLLFCLAPLPIMIAALGWSHWAGLIAAVTGAAIVGFSFGFDSFASFLTGAGVPAWWLGYLALLGRPAPNGSAEAMEWYPAGRLVLWAAVLGAVVVICSLAAFGSDEATMRSALRGAFELVIRRQLGLSADEALHFPGIRDPNRLLDLLVTVMPPVAAVLAAITQTANLWLAGQVVRLSGRLRRPWPDLAAMSFPPLAAPLFAAAVAGSFMPDLPGLLAGLFAATLAVAFALLGFAVIHTLTRPMGSRSVVLSGAYGMVALMGWPALLMTLVGLAETVLGLRRRAARRWPPAAPKT